MSMRKIKKRRYKKDEKIMKKIHERRYKKR